MIHYHGLPVSGSGKDAAYFLKRKHALISHAYPDQIRIAAEVCQSFVLDNGAFTAWKQGRPLDFDGYIEWVSTWCKHPGFDWALIPDVIDGDEKANDAFIERFFATGLGLYGVPVWHLHESFDRLFWLAQEFRTVALGSSGEYSTPGSRKWWGRMREVMDSVCDDAGRPICKLHGLRMMNPEIFTKIPFSSVDSTNASMNAGSTSRFGMYVPPTAGERAEIIASRIEMHNSPAVWA